MLLVIDGLAVIATAVSTFLDTAMTVAEAADSKWVGWLSAGDNTLAWVAALLGADSLLTHGVALTVMLGGVMFLVYKIVADRAEAWAEKHVGSKPTPNQAP